MVEPQQTGRLNKSQMTNDLFHITAGGWIGTIRTV